ncbi:substrate-binding periplasmic protein [Bdellovibrio bacteriovorus]|uniref:substrate-binding periplasmic protein n=1 Tax=Bdellovibrio bacteriovorus TaxID=959 RepID=UPI0035A6A624
MKLILALLFFCSFAGAEESKSLAVAFGKGRPPYSFSERGNSRGIEVDLALEILKRLGYKVRSQVMSPYRIEAEAKHGNTFDVVVGVPRGGDGAGHFYSKPFVAYENYLIALRSRKIGAKKISDLSGLRVGAWHNAWKDLGKDFNRVFSPKANGRLPDNYREFVRQEDQVRALWAGDVDALVMDRYIFGWFRMALASQVNTAVDVDVFDLFPVVNHSYVAFRDAKLRLAFDKELERLRQSGEYDSIVRIYVGERLAAMFKSGPKSH